LPATRRTIRQTPKPHRGPEPRRTPKPALLPRRAPIHRRKTRQATPRPRWVWVGLSHRKSQRTSMGFSVVFRPVLETDRILETGRAATELDVRVTFTPVPCKRLPVAVT